MILAGEHGTVIVHDYWPAPDGRNVRGVSGKLSLLTAEQDFGFTPDKGEASWAVRIDGDTSAVVVMGCQTRGVNLHAPGVAVGEIYEVP